MIQFIILNFLVYPTLALDYYTQGKYLVRWHRQFLMRKEIQRQLRAFALQEQEDNTRASSNRFLTVPGMSNLNARLQTLQSPRGGGENSSKRLVEIEEETKL